jgi:flagellar biogenesis protein FliO
MTISTSNGSIDLIGLLVIVLLVVGIIYLVRRI